MPGVASSAGFTTEDTESTEEMVARSVRLSVISVVNCRQIEPH